MSSVLAGFLVRLGFVVDKDEQAKFLHALSSLNRLCWKAHEGDRHARRRHGHCVLCCIR